MFALKSARAIVTQLCFSVLVAAGIMLSTGATNTALAKRAETVQINKAKANYKFAGVKRVKRVKRYKRKTLKRRKLTRKKMHRGRKVSRALKRTKTRALRKKARHPLIKITTTRSLRGLHPRLTRLLVTVRRHYGRPVIISSGCRSYRHNRRVGGARKSMHLRCMAADFRVAGVSKSVLRRYVSRLPGRGGVGTYCGRSIVHLDVGPRRSWSYGCRKRRRR